MVGFTGRTSYLKTLNDERVIDRLRRFFVYQWKIKLISLLLSVFIVLMKHSGAIGNG